MKTKRSRYKVAAMAWACLLDFVLIPGLLSAAENVPESCTVIGVGKLASAGCG